MSAKTPAELREQTARSIAAEQERVRRPPLGLFSPKSEIKRRKRLAKIRQLAEARATAEQVAAADKSHGLAGVAAQVQKGSKR